MKESNFELNNLVKNKEGRGEVINKELIKREVDSMIQKK